ncbi:MAG: GMC family oxidoreductase N-terminal domain-containing protein [Solirubrobacteraceae bacterium]
MSERALCSLASALLPEEAGGPPARAVAAATEVLLARQPAIARGGVIAAGLALQAMALARHRRPLDQLDPDRRAALFASLGRTGVAGAAALDGIKALLVLANGATEYRDEIDAVARAGPPARPDAELDLLDAADTPAVMRADAVVVGSGAGGAFAARELARRGLSLLIAEEGERWGVERIRSSGPVERVAGLYRDGGATVALGMPPVALPIGRAVGGTTVVNSGTCYRPPPDVVERWYDRHGLALAEPASLAQQLDDVERTLGVARAPDETLGRNAWIALEGAAALGWAASPLRRNAPGCAGSCQCAIGCPRNAKAGVHLNALPQACAAGARIIARFRVDRVLTDDGHAAGVIGHAPDGRQIEVRARLVVIAAGATETPPLLRRSGLGRHPQLGRNLSIHPGLGVTGTFEQPVHAWRGVLQSVGIEQLHQREGILIEATATPPGMGAVAYPGVGAPLLARMARADHVATLGGMVADAPAGRILGRHRALIAYRLTGTDARRLVRAIDAMARTLLAAGASEVDLGGGLAPVRRAAELPAALEQIKPRRLRLAAFHPTGTAAGGGDPARHPADSHGRLRGVRGVLIADASLLPACPGVNPQLSVMALAAAAARAS